MARAARVRRVIDRLDTAGSLGRAVVRVPWAVAVTVVDSIRARRPVTTWWSVRRGQWSYRWPEGRVRDPGRWRDAHDWATQGFRYDMDDLLWRRYRPREGDVVLDLGAGHGGETLRLARMVGQRGRVIAVEAAPTTFDRLAELCRLNRFAQVEPVQVAIGAAPGTVTMALGEQWVAGNIFEGGDVEVPVTTIDALCAERGITHVDWLKMNIEGAERDALIGMQQMAPHVAHLTISCHDFLGTEWGRSLDFVTGWLRDHGFEVEQRGDGDFVQQLYVYAWRAQT